MLWQFCCNWGIQTPFPLKWGIPSTIFLKCVPHCEAHQSAWLLALQPSHCLVLFRKCLYHTRANAHTGAILLCHIRCGWCYTKVWNDKEIAHLSDRSWLCVQLLPSTASPYTSIPLDSFPTCLTPRVSSSTPPPLLGSSPVLLFWHQQLEANDIWSACET